jgi:hypothetical protein
LSARRVVAVTRYRLRFLLQEIDLPPGETLIGRSAACQVTIEDPLLSRQHGRFRVERGQATFEDLGSRNGSFVNGQPVTGVVPLKDGDRIRLGTQELMVCTAGQPVNRKGAGTRPTGFMCHCAGCGLPYPAEAAMCPSCGSSERLDEDTISGVVSESQQRNWTLELLVEVIARAVSLQRWDDVERMLRRARPNVEERLQSGLSITREQVDALSDAAAALAGARRQAEWGRWALAIHSALGWVPRKDVTERLSTLPPGERASLAPAAHKLLESVQARGGPAVEERAGFSGVESLSIPPASGDGE